MTSFTIFGKGNRGSAIASVVAAGGSSVEHIDSSSTGATVNGDVVVLAVPYPTLKAAGEKIQWTSGFTLVR